MCLLVRYIFTLQLIPHYFLVATILHRSKGSINMLVTLDNILVKSLRRQYNKDDVIKLYENISRYDFQFRHLVHKVINNEEDAESVARNFTKQGLPKFINIGCSDEEFKKTYGWPDAEYTHLHGLIETIQTLTQILFSHYHNTWNTTTAVPTTQVTQVTKSLLQLKVEYIHSLENRMFVEPFNLSQIFLMFPTERVGTTTVGVFYNDYVDYDNSL